MGTEAVGGVTGWVAVSQELLGLCVIWLGAVWSASAPSPASAPVGCSARATVLYFQDLKVHDREAAGLDSRSQALPTC